MKIKMWQVTIGNGWNRYTVTAQTIKQAIAKTKKMRDSTEKKEEITKAELIATED